MLIRRKIQWSKISNLASTRIANVTWMLDDSMKSVRHERQSGRFSKSRGLSASVSFLPLPSPSRGNSLSLNPWKCLLRRLGLSWQGYMQPIVYCKLLSLKNTAKWQNVWRRNNENAFTSSISCLNVSYIKFSGFRQNLDSNLWSFRNCDWKVLKLRQGTQGPLLTGPQEAYEGVLAHN